MTDRDRLNRHLDTAKTLCMIATGKTSADRAVATDGDWPTICRDAARDLRATLTHDSDSRLYRLASMLEFVAQDVQIWLDAIRAASLVSA